MILSGLLFCIGAYVRLSVSQSMMKGGRRELKEKGDECRDSVRLLVESAEPSALIL